MVQISQARVKNKTSKPKRKTAFAIKECLYCGELYKGSPQSAYCSKYHMECASRARKSALVDALAELLLTHTPTCQHAHEQAYLCVKLYYTPFRLRLEALGYVYQERERVWKHQPRLAQ